MPKSPESNHSCSPDGAGDAGSLIPPEETTAGTMPLIPLDTETARGVELLACAWGISPAEAIRRLLADLVSEQTPDPSPRDRPVPVYAVYARTRIDAEFHPASGAVAITSGPGRGFYRTPSGASAAVIQALRPMVKPNRTGWQFWHVVQTSAPLASLRGSTAGPVTASAPIAPPSDPASRNSQRR